MIGLTLRISPQIPATTGTSLVTSTDTATRTVVRTAMRWPRVSIPSTNVRSLSATKTSGYDAYPLADVDVDAWLEQIQFYTTLILNIDESTEI